MSDERSRSHGGRPSAVRPVAGSLLAGAARTGRPPVFLRSSGQFPPVSTVPGGGDVRLRPRDRLCARSFIAINPRFA